MGFESHLGYFAKPPCGGSAQRFPPAHKSLYSSVVERQSCKLKVLGSIPSGGTVLSFARSKAAHRTTTRLDARQFGRVV